MIAFPPWSSLGAFGSVSATQPGKIAGTCVFCSTHQRLSRSTGQHSRNQAFSLAPELENTTIALGWAEAVLCVAVIWKKQGSSHPYCPHIPASPAHLMGWHPASPTATVLSVTFLSNQKQWISQEKTLPTELCLPQFHRKPLCG